MNISFIGYGNLAKAIAKGLVKNQSNQIRAASPSLKGEETSNGIILCSSNLAVLPKAELLILAVKPNKMAEVISEIKSHIPKDCLVISVAAGLSIPWFESQGIHQAMVRAMPNVASAISQSATPLFANSKVTSDQKQQAKAVFSTIGLTTWAENEQQIDAFTALSGSGPAYVFRFMEAMINTAITLGIPPIDAKAFAMQTFEGATQLAKSSALELEDLRKQVTSPNGTTAAALLVFSQMDLDIIIEKAMHAAFQRANELASV